MQSPQLRAREHGQASILGIGIIGLAIMLASALVCVAQWSIAHSELQQAADIAAAQLVKSSLDAPQEAARAAATSNGAHTVQFGRDHRGEYVQVSASSPASVQAIGVRTMEARAYVSDITAALPGAQNHITTSSTSIASQRQYTGTLVIVDAARMCPAVASSYRSMQRAAALQGVRLWAVSGYRSYAQQARLYAELGPRIAAPPGRSLHHAATELDIAVGPAGSPVHRWLTVHAPQFGFIQRYSWEPWHWGNVRGC